jgi:NADPH-dependent ferric siderophore reductase
MIRVTFTGPELGDLVIDEPAASVRLLLPSPATTELVIPQWNGNEFLLPDGSRPTIRTFTPRRFDAAAPELDLDMVVHPGGVASGWAAAAVPGSPAALSGPGRGYTIDPEAPEYLLACDETGIPAVSQLLEVLPQEMPVQVHVEIHDEAGQISLPSHPRAIVTWHELGEGRPPGDALTMAVHQARFGPEARVWCAGEAASMHRIRTHLFKERKLPRTLATVRGYWKVERSKPAGSSEA